MEDNGIKSIRYPLEADEKLTKLALGLGRSKKLLFMQMIDYFDKSKKDPKVDKTHQTDPFSPIENGPFCQSKVIPFGQSKLSPFRQSKVIP